MSNPGLVVTEPGGRAGRGGGGHGGTTIRTPESRSASSALSD